MPSREEAEAFFAENLRRIRKLEAEQTKKQGWRDNLAKIAARRFLRRIERG